MLDVLIKGALVLAIGVGVAIAVGYAFDAWRNSYRDKVTDWLHSHCKNTRVRRVLLKAVCFFDTYVAGTVNRMVRWVIKVQNQDGTQQTIKTEEVSIDVAKGAGCIVNDNQLDKNDKTLFDDEETAAMLGIR
ncbi:MAG: hypothetical protein IJQ39_05785 [Thermoguttaceae bacterium]|nr:hypothetical protein [Thermoguttaceae bacterium]